MIMGKFNDGRPEILDSDSWPGSGGNDLFYPAASTNGLSIFEDSDPDDGGDAQADFQMAALFAEVGGAGSFGSFSASTFEQGDDLPFLAKQSGRARKKALKSITLDDFEEGTQRWAAGTVISAVRHFLKNIEKPGKGDDVAQWIFGRTNDQASFENCCIVNEARPDVLRMRIQYELWRCGKVLVRPFPFLADLPTFISNKVLFTVGKAGLNVAKLLWSHPGIEDADLRAQLGMRELEALDAMASMYIVSALESSPQRWYLTSINPILEDLDNGSGVARTSYSLVSRRARSTDISWSSRFGED